jgi:DNA-binding CsgD family transcriptional regulator
MNHILILAGVAGLFAGVWALVVAGRAYRSGGPPFLRHIVLYLLLTNILAARIVIDLYARTNLLEDSNGAFPLWYTMTTYILAYIVRALLLISVVRMALTMLEREMPRALTNAMWTVVGLVGVGHLIGATMLIREGASRWRIWTEAGFAVGVGLAGIGIIVALAAGRHARLSRERARAVRRLATPLVAGYLFMLLAFLVLQSSAWITWQVYLLVVAVTVLWQNGTFLVWLETVFAKTFTTAAPMWSAEAVDELAQKHNITQREREIVDLILEGRSNKEIESALFISPHTVKNHIYNVYKKLGISSRGQMIRLLAGRGGYRSPFPSNEK